MNFTPAQQRAKELTGKSILVSAAAGSGKTSVLAERCSYLVIDAAKPCSIDKLLVLTFAEAAANEMRSRIETTIQRRYMEALSKKGEAATMHLKRQVMLAPAAHISTIHSFCARLIRQNFHLAALDPGFRVLDGTEAQLMREEVAQTLFSDWFDGAESDTLRELIDLYGDGSDESLRHRVIQTHEVLSGVLDRTMWREEALARLEEAAAAPSLKDSEIGRKYLQMLHRRLGSLLISAEDLARRANAYDAPGVYGERANELLLLVQQCIADLERGDFNSASQRLQIKPGTLSGKHGIPKGETEPLKDAYNAIKKELTGGEGALFPLFALPEKRLIEDVGRTLPCVRAFLGLVQQFKQRYDREKRDRNALDFSDLEHTALGLLTKFDGDQRLPSDVARRLHQRYEHVLVDEYQDINPVQEAILKLASRECLCDEGVAGNLFCVGDVKQSIYRFRLAEPNLFLGRRERYLKEGGNAAGEAIDLRENFRTRWPLLEAINGVFRRLMTSGSAEIDYSSGHEFASILKYPEDANGFTGVPIELHLLNKDALTSTADSEDVEQGSDTEFPDADSDNADDDDLDAAEQEARHVALLIRDLLIPPDGKRKMIYVPKEDSFRPIEANDIAILLRSTRQRTREYSKALAQLGIPMRSESRSGFFKAVEVQDVLAVLRALDNQQQDIPLAAVIRSPISGINAPEDALAEIARAYPDIPFHDAMTRYAQEKADPLAAKLQSLLKCLAAWRLLALQRSTDELIATIYRETSLPAWYAALPNGQQRLANLQYLHQCAAKFAKFDRQGLYRFLCFLEEMEERDSLAQPPAGNDGQSVKLMTIHAAKGLEYPVVIVAGLGTKLNLSDGQQLVLLHRDLGLALRVADKPSNTRYPGIACHVIEAEITRASLAEELRVLYVAMTRAREQLILVGSAKAKQIERWRAATGDAPLPEHTFLAGRTFLDWLGPLFASGPAGALTLREVTSLPALPPRGPVAKGGAVSLLDPPSALPRLPVVNQAIDRLQYQYPWPIPTRHPAAVSVTSLSKGASAAPVAVDAERDEVDLAAPFEHPSFASAAQAGPGDEAAARGTAVHLVMQYLDFTLPPESVPAQIERMATNGLLSADAKALVDADDIAWFLSTPTGQILRANAASLLRELPFLDAFAPEGCGDCTGRDQVMLRGRIDAALVQPDGWMVIDYKTDHETPQPGGERYRAYQKQVLLYRNAIERSGLGSVAGVKLVLLRTREILEM